MNLPMTKVVVMMVRGPEALMMSVMQLRSACVCTLLFSAIRPFVKSDGVISVAMHGFSDLLSFFYCSLPRELGYCFRESEAVHCSAVGRPFGSWHTFMACLLLIPMRRRGRSM